MIWNENTIKTKIKMTVNLKVVKNLSNNMKDWTNYNEVRRGFL